MSISKKSQHQNFDFQKGFSYEASHRKSFFQKSFVRMEWTRKKLPKISSDFDLQIEVQLVTKQNTLKTKQISIWQNIMVTHKKNGEKCWLDFENSIFIPIEHEQFGKGLKLIKCFDEIQIFGDIESLSHYIKRFTIQLDFLNNYTILKKISQIEINQQKEIYKINNKKDHRDYQSIIYQKNQIGLELEKQLEKQIYILRRINYDYLQKFYGVFEDKDQIIIITELMIGGSLDSYIYKFPLLSEDKACKLFFKLFKALAYLHSKNIMHRDLKPENIILTLNGNLDYPVINQFSFAEIIQQSLSKRIHDSDDESIPEYLNQRYGTPGYTAPEILRSDYYDFKIDVFSLGIVLFFTVTGKIPFRSKDVDDLIEENRVCEIDYSKLYFSDEGLSFIQSILNPNYSERLTAQLALNHVWFKQERTSELNEHKASNKLKQFTKNSSFRIRQNSPQIEHQKTLTQESSSISGEMYHSPQDGRLQNTTSDFKMKTQSNTFTPVIGRKNMLIKQSSFGRNSQNFSPMKLSPLNLDSKEKTNDIKRRLKKSIFNQS